MFKKLSFNKILCLLLLISVMVVFLALGRGANSISLSETFHLLSLGPGFKTDDAAWQLNHMIIWNLRLPRVLEGYFVGAGLALAGVIMQTLVRNPLADPFLLGVGSGASFFATLGLIFGVFSFLGPYQLPLSAIIGAMVSLIFIQLLSSWSKKGSVLELVLIGLVVSMIFDAATRFVVLSAPNALGIHNTEFWMAGSLVNAKWDYFWIPVSILFLLGFYLFMSYKELNLLAMGDEYARHLGLNVSKSRWKFVLLVSILTGIIISLSGIIGFIGIIAPHWARRWVGGNALQLIPISTILGGVLVVGADILSRTVIAPVELPLGLMTAFLGGPIFIVTVLINLRRGGRARA